MPEVADMPDSTAIPFDVNKAAADIGQALRDGAYVAIGLAVLGFQRAQVRRVELSRQLEGWWGPLGEAGDTPEADGGDPAAQLRELAGRLDEVLAPARERGRQLIASNPALVEAPLETARTQLTQLARTVDERVRPVRQQFDEQFDLIEQYLPPAARSLVQSMRAAAAEPEQRLRNAAGLD
jgi:hypothetical protein